MKHTLLALVAAVLLAGAVSCGSVPMPNIPNPIAPAATATPAPSPTPVGPPSPYGAMEGYLKAWEQARYGEMYDMLSTDAQAGITRERFVQRYQGITEGSTIVSVKTSFTRDDQAARSGLSEELPFSVVMATSRVGEIREENRMPMVLEGDRWKVAWQPSLIFKELGKDDRILFEPDDPVRGSILDRKGRPLAVTGKVVSIGVVPGQVEDEAKLLSTLEQQLKIAPARVKSAMQSAQPDWFVPLKELSSAEAEPLRPNLEGIPGVLLRDKTARVYPNGQVAAHVVGYISRVTADDLKTLAAKGYGEDDFVGRAGIEASVEAVLAGEKGGKLSSFTPAGKPGKLIAQKASNRGQDVQLALDLDIQKLAEDSLGAQVGSAVVLDVKDNSVLALASYPRFDPNQFVIGFSEADWKKLNEDPNHPFENRPAGNSYPIGSVMKVITLSAGLEKGGFTPANEFDCKGSWQVPGTSQIMGDWLPGGHGHLSLLQGLVESCNIVFYEVGKKLDSLDPTILPTFARGFGFGQPTGLNGLPEARGLVPDPAWKKAERNDDWYLGDTVNLAIGQGFFLASPLQVANAYAAVARGGNLLSPVLVSKQGDQAFQAQPKGTLPVPPATLETIRAQMKKVTADPKGTAYSPFRGVKTPVAAKTGAAESEGADSHAWFAAFAPADAPQIALVVMVEEKGLGAQVAGPVARKIVDGFFR